MTVDINIEGLKKLNSSLIDLQYVQKTFKEFQEMQTAILAIFNYSGTVTEKIAQEAASIEEKCNMAINSINELKPYLEAYKKLEGNTDGNSGNIS